MPTNTPPPYTFTFRLSPTTYTRLKTGLVALGYANAACTEITLTKPAKVRLGVHYNTALQILTLGILEKPFIATDGTVESLVRVWMKEQGVV